MPKLFVYGTLQEPRVQKKIIGREVRGTNDSLEGYVRSQIEINNNTYYILIKGKGRTEGMVLELTHDELRKTDEYETDAYRRVTEKLVSGMNAWVYIK